MFIVTAKEMYDLDHFTMHDVGFKSVYDLMVTDVINGIPTVYRELLS